jgi:hypothetical protein
MRCIQAAILRWGVACGTEEAPPNGAAVLGRGIDIRTKFTRPRRAFPVAVVEATMSGSDPRHSARFRLSHLGNLYCA